MELTLQRSIIVLLVFLLGVTSCGSPLVSPESGAGAPTPRWLTFQIRQATVLADKGDGPDGEAECQIYVIATDGETASKHAYPADGVVPVSVGDSIQMGKYAPSVDVEAIGDELVVYVVAVDLDKQSPGAELATDVVIDLMASAVMAIVTEGGSIVLELLGGQVLGQAGAELADWIRAADVIGEDTIVLKRSSGWGVGPARTHRTADGGLEIVYQVYLGEREGAPWTPEPSSSQGSTAGDPLPPGPWRWDHPSDGAWIEKRDGRLVFEVTQPDTVRQYYLDRSITDFRVQVKARQTGGARNSAFGFVFRHQGHQDCYRFTITGNGQFEIGKEVGNEWRYFPGYRNKIEHSCIEGKGEWNTLELVGNGSTFTAKVNGCEVASVQDSSFRSGHMGLLVGTEEDGSSAKVEFYDFVLEER